MVARVLGDKERESLANRFIVGVAGVVIAVILFAMLSTQTRHSDDIGRVIDDVIKTAPYISLTVGQDSYVYLSYNKDGEVIAESSEGGIAFYLKDNSILTVSDTEVKKDYDLNILEFIRNSAIVADELGNRDDGVGSIGIEDLTQEMIESEKAIGNITEDEINNFPKYKLYTITLKGTENIKKVYEKVNEDYANESIDIIEKSFEGTDPEDIDMVMRVRVSDGGDLGAACEFSIGDDIYTNWVFTSYMQTGVDWEFGSDWYNTDTSEHTKWVEMVTEKISEVSRKLAEFVEDMRKSNDATKTGKIDYDTYSVMTEEEKIQLVQDIKGDLIDLGTELSIDDIEFKGKLDEYYADEYNRGVNILQAAINICVRDSLIDMNDVQGSVDTE